MELTFCSQCGISIPLVEVESGAAVAGDGKFLCSEHRLGGDPPGASGAAAAAEPGGSPGEDLELLFCANCNVSIPQSDVRAGRTRREYGSLLCGACAKSDPGERAARRAAVAKEMADDVDAEDPVARERCSVCSAAVPQSHVVTGRARVSGDRVVCERCLAAAEVATPAREGSGATVWVLMLLVVLVAGLAGFFGMQWMKLRDRPEQKDHTAAIHDLESRLARAEADAGADAAKALEAALREERAERVQAVQAVSAQVRDDLRAVRQELADMSGRLGVADQELSQRVAKLDGQLASVVEMVKGLSARPVENGGGARAERAPDPVVREEEVKPPAPGPVVRPPDPAVSKLVKDLLEAPEPGTRFAAVLELGRLKDPSSTAALATALAKDDNVMVRRAAARALGDLKAWFAVPGLVDALEEREAYVAQQANFSLLTITGEDFGVTQDQSLRERKQRASAARKWWDKNKEAPPEGVSLEAATLVR